MGEPKPGANCEPQPACNESARNAAADGASPFVLRCAVCRRANASSRKFCAHCGKSLWEACPKCGEVSPAGERFCGVCGVNLTEYVEQCIQHFVADLEKVESLRRQCRFSEAIAALASLSKSDHPRLNEESARAGRVIKQLQAERDRKRIVAFERFQEAGKLLEQSDFAGGLAALAGVPGAMWTPEMATLSEQLKAKQERLSAMERELTETIRDRRLFELPGQIDRLLKFKPDHAQSLQLAQKLESQLVKAAKEKLAALQYDDAVNLLTKLVGSSVSEETARLREHARELAWISYDLRAAPEADAALLTLAERLRRVMPQDQPTLKAYDEIRKRRNGAADKVAVAWSPPPEKTPFGCPVRRLVPALGDFLRDGFGGALLGGDSGAWLGALGLALQALGAGPVTINLFPSETRSVMNRMARWARSRPLAAWGLDLGSTTLRAVRMKRVGSRAVVDACAAIVHRKPLSLAMNIAEEEHILADTFNALLQQVKLKGDKLALSVPGRLILTRQFKVPSINQAKFSELVEFESKQQFPIRLEDLVWDFQPAHAIAVNPRKLKCEQTEFGETAVFVTAAKRAQVIDRIRFLAGRKLPIDLIQAEGLALHNALGWLGGAGAFPAYGVEDPSAAVIVADLGGEAMNLLIRAPDAMWLRTVGLGGQSFSRAIKQEFDVSLQVAEGMKHDAALAPSFGRFCDAVAPVFEDIVHELLASFDSFQKANPGHVLQEVLITGGAAQIHGLLRHLRNGR